MNRYTIVPAPTNLGLRPTGVEHLADALLALKLATILGAEVNEAVGMGEYSYSFNRDPETGYLNGPGIRDHALRLSRAVGTVLESGRVAVVLGGDCSILIGCALALRAGGRHGLLFVDGHSDFYDSREHAYGEVAGMDFGIVTGHSDNLLSNIGGGRPYIAGQDACVFAFREEGLEEHRGYRDVRATGALTLTLSEVRAEGLDQALGRALSVLAQPELKGFFIHFDADVLDDAIMPAVDYRLPGGLTAQEATKVLRAASAIPSFRGISVSIYNPKLDSNSASGQRLVNLLCDGLR